MRAFAPDAAPHALEIFPGAALQQPLTLRRGPLPGARGARGGGPPGGGKTAGGGGDVGVTPRRNALCPPRPLHCLHPDDAEEAGDEREPPP